MGQPLNSGASLHLNQALRRAFQTFSYIKLLPPYLLPFYNSKPMDYVKHSYGEKIKGGATIPP